MSPLVIGPLLVVLAPPPPAEARRDVIVVLRGGAVSAPEVLSTLEPASFALTRRYAAVPAFAGRLTERAIEALARDPRVASIEEDLLGHPTDAESTAAIHAREASASFGLDGRGVTVAVLDTGVDGRHPDLDGSVVAQHCFVAHGCPPNGADSGVLAPEGDGHGTHVSGIIAGQGVVGPPGVAPGARLVVIRVFDAQSVGRVSDWVAALDWVAANRESLGVRVVNMSLGTDAVFSGACDQAQPAMSAAVGLLRDAGVVVFAASGNDGRSDAMNAPACIAGVVAVAPAPRR